MLTFDEKCARVEKFTTEYPEWWSINVTDMSIELLVKLGVDPRDANYFGLHVIQFVRVTEALDDDDPDLNSVCTTLAKKLHPAVDFHKLGIQDDIVDEGRAMHQMRLLNDMYDDPSLDHPDYYCEDQ